ncbi:hypothetical protein ODV97_04230 [Enterococcus gallinarum]|nr:hypothetical protein [Enterococcus gallinarum]
MRQTKTDPLKSGLATRRLHHTSGSAIADRLQIKENEIWETLIQFPKPEDCLRHSAEKAYQAKDYLKAYHDYQEIYTEHSSFEINQSLVKCLQQLADFAKALEVADDFLDEYLQDPNGFVQIGHLLILDGQYSQARKWIRLAEEFPVISEAASETLVKELDKVEEVQQILGLEDFLGKNSHCLQWTAATNQLAGTHGTFFPKDSQRISLYR